MKSSYKITLQIDGLQRTEHFVYSYNIDDAKRAAVKIAERIGGSFLDIVSVELAPFIDDKRGF